MQNARFCSICSIGIGTHERDIVEKDGKVYHWTCARTKLPNKVSNEVLNAHVKRVRQDYFRFKEGTRVQ